MINLLLLAASKLVPKENFPLDKTLAGHSIINNLITSVVILLFITLVAWIVYEAFDEKRDD